MGRDRIPENEKKEVVNTTFPRYIIEYFGGKKTLSRLIQKTFENDYRRRIAAAEKQQ